MSEEIKGPAWFYRKGEAKLFEDGVCPKGWVDSPAKVKGGADEPAEAPVATPEAGE